MTYKRASKYVEKQAEDARREYQRSVLPKMFGADKSAEDAYVEGYLRSKFTQTVMLLDEEPK